MSALLSEAWVPWVATTAGCLGLALLVGGLAQRTRRTADASRRPRRAG